MGVAQSARTVAAVQPFSQLTLALAEDHYLQSKAAAPSFAEAGESEQSSAGRAGNVGPRTVPGGSRTASFSSSLATRAQDAAFLLDDGNAPRQGNVVAAQTGANISQQIVLGTAQPAPTEAAGTRSPGSLHTSGPLSNVHASLAPSFPASPLGLDREVVGGDGATSVSTGPDMNPTLRGQGKTLLPLSPEAPDIKRLTNDFTRNHESGSASETTEVHVTIGRVEVTAVYPQPQEKQGKAAPNRRPPPMSLDEYLARRQGGRL